jgi:hypothetical protein
MLTPAPFGELLGRRAQVAKVTKDLEVFLVI